jgi:hypothetical protein
MALTKRDLNQVIKKQLDLSLKKYHVSLTRFLEKKVIEPIFELQKDVGVLKKDVGVLKKDMNEVRFDITHINRRMEAFIDRDDRQDVKLKDHGKRIEKLEESSTFAAS